MYQFIFFKLSASSIILCSMRQTQKQTSSRRWFLKSHNESHYLDVRKLCEHRFPYLIIVMFHHFSVRQIMFLSHLVVLKSLRTERWFLNDRGDRSEWRASSIRYQSLYRCTVKGRWHIFQSVRPRWEHEALLSTLILWDGPFWNHLFTVGGKALRSQRSALGHSYRRNPGAFPSMCTLHLGETPQKVKAHIVGNGAFHNFLVTGLLTMLFWLG